MLPVLFGYLAGSVPFAFLLARRAGIDVRVWYVALNSPEFHIARVRARVSRGGHDIPEREIRRRYDASRHNLIELLPRLASLRVYDNSNDADPAESVAPSPVLLLHMERGRVEYNCEPAFVPEWAKPIVLIAFGNATR